MSSSDSVLRTLAPALKRLQELVAQWLASARTYPLSVIDEAELRSLMEDLGRHAEALSRERVVLNIVLMGGTGVGKSTLLNALAGAPIAHASGERPTTRDPVVYHHRSLALEHLEAPLRGCLAVPHDRSALENKIIVDTPDLDSTELANRARLEAVLPVADLVIYVGSQEKYHDRLGWELFRKHRPRRGFAFVLNKWDRCVSETQASGLRPDEDLLEDLRREGFHNPLLFRVCASAWVEANGQAPVLPQGEQFRELVAWLEYGLTQREIEAIKARGVHQTLTRLEAVLDQVRPPDLADAAAKAQRAWQKIIKDEVGEMADVLLNSLDHHEKDIERYFRDKLYGEFRGPMKVFLELGPTLRSGFRMLTKFLPQTRFKSSGATSETEIITDLPALLQDIPELRSAEAHVDARWRAMPNKLLVTAEQNGFPITLLNQAIQRAADSPRQDQFSYLLKQSGEEVQKQWHSPLKPRYWVLRLLVFLGEWVPTLALLAALLLVLNNFFPFIPVWNIGRPLSVWEAIFLPILVSVATLVLLYILVRILLPIRWKKIRGLFHEQVRKYLLHELEAAYGQVPTQVAERLREERRQVDAVLDEVRKTRNWLDSREHGRDAVTPARVWGQN
ncbi:MAG: 50S ribosome-binding GTPase [Gemmatales bacterium]|nr:50S ribosome-binding GTPase [Gemmatales bacterium]MDW8387350.1 GTPase [Gemmatales bacterium]